MKSCEMSGDVEEELDSFGHILASSCVTRFFDSKQIKSLFYSTLVKLDYGLRWAVNPGAPDPEGPPQDPRFTAALDVVYTHTLTHTRTHTHVV